MRLCLLCLDRWGFHVVKSVNCSVSKSFWNAGKWIILPQSTYCRICQCCLLLLPKVPLRVALLKKRQLDGGKRNLCHPGKSKSRRIFIITEVFWCNMTDNSLFSENLCFNLPRSEYHGKRLSKQTGKQKHSSPVFKQWDAYCLLRNVSHLKKF